MEYNFKSVAQGLELILDLVSREDFPDDDDEIISYLQKMAENEPIRYDLLENSVRDYDFMLSKESANLDFEFSKIPSALDKITKPPLWPGSFLNELTGRNHIYLISSATLAAELTAACYVTAEISTELGIGVGMYVTLSHVVQSIPYVNLVGKLIKKAISDPTNLDGMNRYNEVFAPESKDKVKKVINYFSRW